ncbi:MAG: hypothetical protein QW707_06035 [Candidatus Bathyarchaeia archaeon]
MAATRALRKDGRRAMKSHAHRALHCALQHMRQANALHIGEFQMVE